MTKEEQTLYDGLKMESLEGDDCAENARRSRALMRSLIGRRAIPGIRSRYFLDADMNPGGTKSRREVFVGNGCLTDEEIFSHPHFLKYLRYFVEGPRLPASVIVGFRSVAGDSLREWNALDTYARARARELSMTEAQDVGEEFFKLALECGVEFGEARRIRTAARTAARGSRRR